jgi:hypothetical protein
MFEVLSNFRAPERLAFDFDAFHRTRCMPHRERPTQEAQEARQYLMDESPNRQDYSVT